METKEFTAPRTFDNVYFVVMKGMHAALKAVMPKELVFDGAVPGQGREFKKGLLIAPHIKDGFYIGSVKETFTCTIKGKDYFDFVVVGTPREISRQESIEAIRAFRKENTEEE
jgi:hypothetical protein